jgi:hypothetical protein
MGIDIDRLSEQELIDLNHRIVHRLRFMREARAHSEMLRFRIGDRVYFRSSDGRTVNGTLTRYNKKSVTVIAEAGERWTVSPQLLIRVEDPSTPEPQRPQIPRILE